MTTRRMSLALLAAAALVLACEPDRAPLGPTERPDAAARRTSDVFLTTNASGQMGTVSTTGTIDASNAFFRSLGTNGRSCGTCHLEASAFGLSAEAVQAVFAATGGTDPLFAPVDGANCPSVTPADGAAGHSLLLNQGLIRVKPGHSRRRGVHHHGGPRPVRLRAHGIAGRGIGVPPGAAHDQPALPERGDVGRAGNRQARPTATRSPQPAGRPAAPGDGRDAGARPGSRLTHGGAAQRDRGFRDGAVHAPSRPTTPRACSRPSGANGGPVALVSGVVLPGDQRPAG